MIHSICGTMIVVVIWLSSLGNDAFKLVDPNNHVMNKRAKLFIEDKC